jgi:hypothetical protein
LTRITDHYGRFSLLGLDAGGIEYLRGRYGSRIEDPRVLENVLTYAWKRKGGKSVLIEEGYIDKDFRDEFSGLYSRTFKSFSSSCVRLHFFDRKIKSIADVRESPDGYGEHYLGFTVIRPIDIGKVGRTAIKPWIKDANECYTLCTCDMDSHLFGVEYNTHCAPYIQQDSMVMSCAQASMWMASRYMHKRFGYRQHLPFEITQTAAKYFSIQRFLPSEGLNMHAMFNALRDMGYSPICFAKGEDKGTWNTVESISRYIESCMPVIAMVPRHAIVVIGHTFSYQRRRLRRLESYRRGRGTHQVKGALYAADSWIDAFVVHDTSLGPYRLLPVTEGDADEIRRKGFGDFLPPRGEGYQTVKDIEAIMVPLPEKVFVLAEHINDIIQSLFDREYLLAGVAEYCHGPAPSDAAFEFLRSLLVQKDNPLVARSYVTSSTEYKRSLRSAPLATEMHPVVLKAYQKMSMPRFVWLVEITNKRRFAQKREAERTMFGEIIIDATANKFGLSFLAFHMPGVLHLHDTQEDVVRTFRVPGDRPYPVGQRLS